MVDPQTGLYLMGGAVVRRRCRRSWPATIPISFLGGQTNLMEFCGDDPTNFIDPSGMAVVPPLWHSVFMGRHTGRTVDGYKAIDPSYSWERDDNRLVLSCDGQLAHGRRRPGWRRPVGSIWVAVRRQRVQSANHYQFTASAVLAISFPELE